MANLQLYVVAYVTIASPSLGKSVLLTEHAECTLTRNSNANPVRTVGKGFAGVSPGAPDCEIDIQNAVPAADFEVDPGTDIFENNVVEVGIVGPGGKTAQTSGFIMSDTFSHGVGKEGTLAFKIHAAYPKWQG